MRSWLRSWAEGYRRVAAGSGGGPPPSSSRGAASNSTPASGCGPDCDYAKDVADRNNTSAHALARHYTIRPHLLPPAYGPVIQPLCMDAEAQAFLDSCEPSWWLDWAARLLRLFYSTTDANGLLKRGSMFVLSRASAFELLSVGLAEARQGAHRRGGEGGCGAAALSLLDVGAGDGDVTARLVAGCGFNRVTCTEVSKPMAARLSARGWTVKVTGHINASALPESGSYDVVSLLNLLDRCDHPRDMLADAARLAVPGTGRILIALVLPFSEFVEEGTKRRKPYGPLNMAGARCSDGAGFEASLSAFLTRTVQPCGLLVERVARVPYLCRGDSRHRYYVLSDAILVLRHATAAERAAGIVTVAGTQASSQGSVIGLPNGSLGISLQ